MNTCSLQFKHTKILCCKLDTSISSDFAAAIALFDNINHIHVSDVSNPTRPGTISQKLAYDVRAFWDNMQNGGITAQKHHQSLIHDTAETSNDSLPPKNKTPNGDDMCPYLSFDTMQYKMENTKQL
jgi:hypothetical protein